MSRGEIDAYTEFVKIYGAKGLAWIKVNDLAKGREGLQSPIVKNLHDRAVAEVLARTGAQAGDLIFFAADKAKVVNDALGALRVKIGHSEFGRSRGLFDDVWAPLWVVDFPMFEYDDEAQRWNAVHHPFTAPKDGHEDLMDTDPGRLRLEGLRHGAQRLGTRRRLGAYPPRRRAEQGLRCAEDRAPRRRRRSSASCSMRCSTARRRTAGWRSASTASSR